MLYVKPEMYVTDVNDPFKHWIFFLKPTAVAD